MTPSPEEINQSSFEPDQDYARHLDSTDPLATRRADFEFPLREDGRAMIYLCGNSLGLMPTSVRARMQEELDDWGRLGVEGHFEATSVI